MSAARGPAAICTLALAILAGCGAAIQTTADAIATRDEAQKVAEEYFTLARSKDWDAMEALYTSEFFAAVPLETWRKILPNIDRELGSLGPCTQESWNVEKKFGTEFSGIIVNLAYRCEHERYPALVTFAIARAEGEKTFKILGQNFDSLGFLVE